MREPEFALQWKDEGQQSQVAREIYSDFIFFFLYPARGQLISRKVAGRAGGVFILRDF